VQDKLRAIEEVFGKDAQSVDHLDGITVDYGDWWFNVRPSNTEPLLRLNIEANNRALMEQKRDELLAFIRE
jgi:phosphomannomutase